MIKIKLGRGTFPIWSIKPVDEKDRKYIFSIDPAQHIDNRNTIIDHPNLLISNKIKNDDTLDSFDTIVMTIYKKYNKYETFKKTTYRLLDL